MADISRSVYIQTITGLLRHPRLKALTQRYGYRVKVGVHHTVADRFGPDVLSGIEVVGDEFPVPAVADLIKVTIR